MFSSLDYLLYFFVIYGVYVFNWPIQVQVTKRIYIYNSNSKYQSLPLLSYIFHDYVFQEVVPSYPAQLLAWYRSSKNGVLYPSQLCSLWCVKKWGALWPKGRIYLFDYYTHNVTLCRPKWKRLTYKTLGGYILSGVWLRFSPFSQFSSMQYMDGVCVYSLPISPLMSVIFDDICTLCYYHNQIGTMNQWTFVIFRSWSDGMRWICYNVLIGSGNGHNLAIMMHHIDSTYTIVACGDHNTHHLYRVTAIKQTMTKRAGDLGMRRSLRECQVQSSQLYHTTLYTLHNNGALHAIQQTFLHL